MQVLIHWGQLDASDALGEHVNAQVEHAMRHFSDRFTRVEVHLHDENAAKGGAADKRCVMEARPRGADPVVAEGTGDDFHAVVTAAAKKLERVARHFVERHRDH